MMKARESLSQGGLVFAIVEEVDEPVMKKSQKQPDFVTLEKRKKAAKAKKAKLPKKPSNHTKIKESRNNLAVDKWLKQIISQQTRIISDNAKYANRIRHNPKFLPKRTVGNTRPAEQFNQPEVQAESIYNDLAAANRQAEEAVAAATPMTAAEARRSANQMSRAQNDTRVSQGLSRIGRPPGPRTIRRLRRGGELPIELIIPGIASGNVQNRIAGIENMTPIPVLVDRQPIERRNRPRRMYQSDFSNSSEDDLDDELSDDENGYST